MYIRVEIMKSEELASHYCFLYKTGHHYKKKKERQDITSKVANNKNKKYKGTSKTGHHYKSG